MDGSGIRDSILLLNQLLVLFTGMAGRVGFNGMEDRERFLNRYYAFGHSGHFEGENPESADEFMRLHWLPLLLNKRPPVAFDARERPTALRGLTIFLLNKAAPIKLALYVTPFVLLTLWVNGFRRAAIANDAARAKAAAALSASNALTDSAVGSIERVCKSSELFFNSFHYEILDN